MCSHHDSSHSEQHSTRNQGSAAENRRGIGCVASYLMETDTANIAVLHRELTEYKAAMFRET